MRLLSWFQRLFAGSVPKTRTRPPKWRKTLKDLQAENRSLSGEEMEWARDYPSVFPLASCNVRPGASYARSHENAPVVEMGNASVLRRNVRIDGFDVIVGSIDNVNGWAGSSAKERKQGLHPSRDSFNNVNVEVQS